MNVSTQTSEIDFLQRELTRLKNALESVAVDSKEYSRLIKAYLPVEKRYAARISELEKSRQRGLEF